MILDQILEHKKAELRHKQSRGYLADLKSAIRDAPPPLGFAVTLDATRTATSPALIAEVKKASPSLGLLRPEFSENFDYLRIARSYHEHGASALSVLTDKDFFQGDLRYLAEIKKALPMPALDKEFMVGDIQFYEARAHGADAVLLIVAALEKRQLIDFHALATELKMDTLFETHHERELDTVLEWIYRYARQARLVDGASEVHKMVLSGAVLEEGRGARRSHLAASERLHAGRPLQGPLLLQHHRQPVRFDDGLASPDLRRRLRPAR